MEPAGAIREMEAGGWALRSGCRSSMRLSSRSVRLSLCACLLCCLLFGSVFQDTVRTKSVQVLARCQTVAPRWWHTSGETDCRTQRQEHDQTVTGCPSAHQEIGAHNNDDIGVWMHAYLPQRHSPMTQCKRPCGEASEKLPSPLSCSYMWGLNKCHMGFAGWQGVRGATRRRAHPCPRCRERERILALESI